MSTSTITFLVSEIKAFSFLNLLESTGIFLASVSLFLAYLKYRSDVNNSTKTAVIELISFFRTEILNLNDEFINHVRNKKDENYRFVRVQLNEPTIQYIKDNFKQQTKRQAELINETKCLPKQIKVLNALEEFSLKVKQYKAANHIVLKSVINTFVELVEIHAVALLSARDITTGEPTYEGTLNLYNIWKDIADRRMPDERREELLQKLK